MINQLPSGHPFMNLELPSSQFIYPPNSDSLAFSHITKTFDNTKISITPSSSLLPNHQTVCHRTPSNFHTQTDISKQPHKRRNHGKRKLLLWKSLLHIRRRTSKQGNCNSPPPCHLKTKTNTQTPQPRRSATAPTVKRSPALPIRPT